MVNGILHIICGNCGQNLKEKNMANWKYEPAIIDEETKEIINDAEVIIECNCCGTIHFLSDYIKEIVEVEDEEKGN